jgi:hypothetical protein
MSGSILHSEVNKHICEAVNCYAKASTNITVKVGNSSDDVRTIELNLCNKCVKNFQEKEDIIVLE